MTIDTTKTTGTETPFPDCPKGWPPTGDPFRHELAPAYYCPCSNCGKQFVSTDKRAVTCGKCVAALVDEVDERMQLRAALQRIAGYCGGAIGEVCSHQFHLMVADEVSLVMAKNRAEIESTKARLGNALDRIARLEEILRKAGNLCRGEP